jgi:hypothetical protein
VDLSEIEDVEFALGVISAFLNKLKNTHEVSEQPGILKEIKGDQDPTRRDIKEIIEWMLNKEKKILYSIEFSRLPYKFQKDAAKTRKAIELGVNEGFMEPTKDLNSRGEPRSWVLTQQEKEKETAEKNQKDPAKEQKDEIKKIARELVLFFLSDVIVKPLGHFTPDEQMNLRKKLKITEKTINLAMEYLRQDCIIQETSEKGFWVVWADKDDLMLFLDGKSLYARRLPEQKAMLAYWKNIYGPDDY